MMPAAFADGCGIFDQLADPVIETTDVGQRLVKLEKLHSEQERSTASGPPTG
jgi:hypothetical protein